MNYIKHLSAFFEKAAADLRLNPSHVSLYMALFQLWNLNRFENPLSINRGQVMKLSKIGSSHTYLKCLHDLNSFGYINYHPSHNPLKGSLVNLCTFDTSTAQEQPENLCKSDTSTAQALHNYLCKSGTSSEQVLHPSLNIINSINNKTIYEENSISEIPGKEISDPSKNNKREKHKTQKIKKENIKSGKNRTGNNGIASGNNDYERQNSGGPAKRKMFRPSLDDVIVYFKSENYPELEARKFFNHFESNGWKVGGKTPMKNWNAAARNWMLNNQRFIPPHNFPQPQQKPKPGSNDKDYSEPL